jgi:hypothetical protein
MKHFFSSGTVYLFKGAPLYMTKGTDIPDFHKLGYSYAAVRAAFIGMNLFFAVIIKFLDQFF